jgi:transcriptional regulator with XRE-family HTH domain
MRRLSEAATRIKRLKGAQSQGEFAGEVGIPQSRLSEYERGERVPVTALIKFGHFAFVNGWYGDAKWFFEQAGIDMDLLIGISNLPAKDARDAASSGIQIENVLLHPMVQPGEKRAGSAGYPQPLPAWMVPRGGTTFYVEATDDFIVPFKRGDLILVDGSEINESNLLESFVVAYRPNNFSDEERSKLERNWAEQLSPEQAKLRRDRRQFPFLRTGIFVGRLTFGGARGIEIRTKSGDMLLEYLRPDAHELLLPETDAERKAKERMARRPASGRAASKSDSVFQRYTDLQILGRAIGWLSAPPSKFPERGAEKVKRKNRDRAGK